MAIPATAHFCYSPTANCAVVVVESASLAFGFKKDAMLIGFALIIVAVFLMCGLLFRLSVYALPLFVAFLAGSAVYRSDSGLIAALGAAALTAFLILVVAQLAMAYAKSDWVRALIGLVFAAPAAVAGYYAVHGIAAAAMPQGIWQQGLAVLGATMVATASWLQWGRTRR